MKEHLEILGKKCSDVVTGLEGVVTSISFDLVGCIQAFLQPKHGKDGKPGEGRWIDIARLKIGGSVMRHGFTTPSIEKGPSDKLPPREGHR